MTTLVIHEYLSYCTVEKGVESHSCIRTYPRVQSTVQSHQMLAAAAAATRPSTVECEWNLLGQTR